MPEKCVNFELTVFLPFHAVANTLERRVNIYETGGGPPRVGHCAWMEFECPDAAGPPPGSLMLMGVGI